MDCAYQRSSTSERYFLQQIHQNAKHFDVYILSDSYNPDICIAEQKAWMELIAEVGGEGQIFYRRRRRRVKRKSGNIDDFCRRWGSQYSYMVVLDADSVMTGDCLCGLVRLMEANPNTGIIQSSPKASGMDTLYARCQQFATRVYGHCSLPVCTSGNLASRTTGDITRLSA